MINKTIDSPAAAVRDIFDGATVMIGGFGEAGSPIELIHALIDQGTKNLTVVNNNTGSGHVGLAALIENRQVSKMICSFPRTANSLVFPELYRANEIELELVPQGTLAERIRAGGFGIGGFYVRTGVGTEVALGKESKIIDGLEYLLEMPIKADYALIRADVLDVLDHRCDRWQPSTCDGLRSGLRELDRSATDLRLAMSQAPVGSPESQRLATRYQRTLEQARGLAGRAASL